MITDSTCNILLTWIRVKLTIFSLKLTYHLKIDGWNTSFFFLDGLFFRCELFVLGSVYLSSAMLNHFAPNVQGLRQGDWSARQRNTMERNLVSLFAHTVDGWNPANQFRLVVYPIIYRVSYIPDGARFQPSTVGNGFSTNQMVNPLVDYKHESFLLGIVKQHPISRYISLYIYIYTVIHAIFD